MIRCGSNRTRSTGYSTFGWVLVSAAVEAAAKEPLSSFMTAQVFKPLGMTATTFESSTEPIGGSGHLLPATVHRRRR